MGHFKDTILDRLAREANVAQFVSFDPALRQRHAWIRGHEPNHTFGDLRSALAAMLAAAPEASVNIRSYEPENPKSRAFLYGRRGLDEVEAEVRQLAAEGLYTIVNETVDVNDGGVSGVAYGDVFEFAPGDTPRCVEKPGTAALPRELGRRLFDTVYRFTPELPADPTLRVEFSIHPLRRGFRHGHTIIWEMEHPGLAPAAAQVSWPNRFSRLLGDKAFGLLIAHLVGLPVPRTQAVPRGLAPFSFGTDTGLEEVWIRTCPTVQVPGKFTTQRGWRDPFRLMQEEDPQGTDIASILCQQGVDAAFAGALIAQAEGEPLIEGVAGTGDAFMTGRQAPETLPAEVRSALLATYRQAAGTLGPVRFEWVHDGRQVWVVQLHRGASASVGRTIYPGTASRYHRFAVDQGLEALRSLIGQVEGRDEGIVLVGRVGVTSHFGDVLRRAAVPSRIEEPAAP